MGETMHRTPKSLRGAKRRSSLKVLYHHAKISGARTLWSFLSITLLNDGIWAHDFAVTPLECRNDFDTVG